MKKNWMALSAAAIFALAYSATASAARQDSTSGTTSAQSSETKHEGAGMKTTKTKAQRVVGTVKTYDAGKKLVVTGPKNKDYSYDLDNKDETANIDPAVAVGGKVRVVKSTDADGKVTVTVSPYTGGMHHKGMKKSTSTTESSSSTQ